MRELTRYLASWSAVVMLGTACAEPAATGPRDAPATTSTATRDARSPALPGARSGLRDTLRPVAPDEVLRIVHFTAAPGITPPRMAEVIVQHSEDLALVESTALDGAVTGEKQVVAQARSGGKVRLVVFSSSNLNPLGAGDWAALRFRKVSSGPADVAIAYDRTAFAPAALTPGPDNLRIDGEGEGTP